MTSSLDVILSHTSTSLPTIYTANGSPMHVSYLGNVSTLALSVSNVYQIPTSTYFFSSFFLSLFFSLSHRSPNSPNQNEKISSHKTMFGLYPILALNSPLAFRSFISHQFSIQLIYISILAFILITI